MRLNQGVGPGRITLDTRGGRIGGERTDQRRGPINFHHARERAEAIVGNLICSRGIRRNDPDEATAAQDAHDYRVAMLLRSVSGQHPAPSWPPRARQHAAHTKGTLAAPCNRTSALLAAPGHGPATVPRAELGPTTSSHYFLRGFSTARANEVLPVQRTAWRWAMVGRAAFADGLDAILLTWPQKNYPAEFHGRWCFPPCACVATALPSRTPRPGPLFRGGAGVIRGIELTRRRAIVAISSGQHILFPFAIPPLSTTRRGERVTRSRPGRCRRHAPGLPLRSGGWPIWVGRNVPGGRGDGAPAVSTSGGGGWGHTLRIVRSSACAATVVGGLRVRRRGPGDYTTGPRRCVAGMLDLGGTRGAATRRPAGAAVRMFFPFATATYSGLSLVTSGPLVVPDAERRHLFG